MASVLTQGYLLLSEEPLEKMAVKLASKDPVVSNSGTNLIDYGALQLSANGLALKTVDATKSTPNSTSEATVIQSLHSSDPRISNAILPSNVKVTTENNCINGQFLNNNEIHLKCNGMSMKNDTTSVTNGFVPSLDNLDDIDDETETSFCKERSSLYQDMAIEKIGMETKCAESRSVSRVMSCSDQLAEAEDPSQVCSDETKSEATEFVVKYKWTNIVAIFSVHLLAVFGVGYMAWNWSTLTILFSFLTGGLSGFGVTGGAHRLWTHKAYKAKTPLQLILLFCYTLAGQNTVYEWVRDHRVHHKYSETDADPHNSNRGFFFSHVGWLLTRKHPDVIEKGNKIDMSDITSDPLLEWHRRYFSWLRFAICYVLPVWIPMHFWNETFTYAFFSNTVRYAMSLNATWSVNSFAHIWGYKPYDRRIKPVENLGVAIFAMGEGWHNYHHAFPWDYRASEMGYRYNLTAFLIDEFAKIGWAYDLKKPSESLVATMAAKYGEVPRRRDEDLQAEQEKSKKIS